MPQLFVNRLTILDFSYLDAHRGLLGESWLLDLQMEGELDQQGMLLDFGLLKRQVKGFVKRQFDHRLLAPENFSGCRVREIDAGVEVEFKYAGAQRLVHRSPAEALCLLPVMEITPKTVAVAIRQRLLPFLPDNVRNLQIRLYPESIPGAYYQYSHGLKQHNGNCRRIAHGHRSRLEVWRNGSPDHELARAWVDQWRDIYIANRADLFGEQVRNNVLYSHFAYNTPVGRFELEIPSSACCLIDMDTTVENIARYIADSLQQSHPVDSIEVHAYEGIDKGAVATKDPK